MVALKFEISPSARAGCKNCKQKIQKGVLRVGTVVMVMGNDSLAWRHICCFTQKQISNTPEGGAAQETYAALNPTCKTIVDRMFAGDAIGRNDLADMPPEAFLAGLDRPPPKADSSSDSDDDASSSSSGSDKKKKKNKKEAKKDKKKDKSKKSKKDKKKKAKKEKTSKAAKKKEDKKKSKKAKKEKKEASSSSSSDDDSGSD